MDRVRPSAIRELLRLGADPQVISFGGGYPDPALFPVDELHEVYARLLTPERAVALQYTASNGLPHLRAQVAERLTRDGMACTADDVLIIQGGQQGLDLAAKLVVDPGDVIVTENPTFLGALIAFAPTEPAYAPVRTDADGMDTDHLEEVLAAHPNATMLYTVPDFQNPTGVTLSLARRHRLIELANAYGLLVVEDTPYRALRYAGSALPTLKSLDTEGRVLHLGSFSKILAPGMRLGWALASPEILERLGPAQAGRGHPEQHAQHDRDLGLPHPLRHRRPHRAGDPGLPAQARPDARDDGGDLPRRRAASPSPTAASSSG